MKENNRRIKNSIEALLDQTFHTAEGGEITGSDLIAKLLFKKALQGNSKAFEIIRDSVGESPVVRVIDEVDQSVIDEVEEIIAKVEAEEGE